eukprot:5787908-Pyramimonas_sp.AAC.1
MLTAAAPMSVGRSRRLLGGVTPLVPSRAATAASSRRVSSAASAAASEAALAQLKSENDRLQRQ